MKALQISGLTVRHRGARTDVLHDISLEVARAECVAVVGASGSGKSTLARAAIGLAPTGSSVRATTLRIDGIDVGSASERAWNGIRGRRVGFVLQDALVSLDPLRTIGAELGSALVAHRLARRGQQRESARELLHRVHAPELVDRLDAHPHELSGGQRQRVLIGSAIAAEPALLIADEPTSSLDASARDGILSLFAEWRDAGGSVLLVTHDLEAARRVADRVIVLDAGRIVEQGPPDAVWSAPSSTAAAALVDAAILTRADEQTDAGVQDAAVSASADDPVLEFEGVSFRHRGAATGVHDVSLTLRRGRSIGIVGPSGSGKSTIARLALGFAEPDAGAIRLGTQEWSSLRERDRRLLRARIQLVHQDGFGAFDPRHRVGRILDEALDLRNVPNSERSAHRVELLQQVALSPELLSRRAGQLSGGQRQRVAIARALATEPEVLVCDESVSALDTVTQAAIIRLLRDLQVTAGIALLVISHDRAVVDALCPQVLELRDGSLTAVESAARKGTP